MSTQLATRKAPKLTVLERIGVRLLTKRFHGGNSAENPNVPLADSDLFNVATGANITVQTRRLRCCGDLVGGVGHRAQGRRLPRRKWARGLGCRLRRGNA